MDRNLKVIIILFLFWASLFEIANGQISSINDVINQYASVSQVYNNNELDLDSVKVNDASVFSKGDAVLLMQMKGAVPDLFSGATQDPHFVGKYEILKIQSILSGNVIVFTSRTNLIPGDTYDVSAHVQLIKVPIYETAVVENDVLTCKQWDRNSGTGGVLALMATDSLVLNDDIDVSGKGFQGANSSSDDFDVACSVPIANGFDDLYYSVTADDSAGMKGEGLTVYTASKARGKGALTSGPGGGNHRFAGGGGGSNYGEGGNGGRYSCIENSGSNTGGVGGRPMSFLYTNTQDRIFMGAGGGMSSFAPGYTAAPGGDGGGIVIILSPKIVSVSGNIKANGMSVTTVSSAGGGGGGAGGSIVLDVDEITGSPVLEATGGYGGDTDVNCGGPGGGGGGGIIWYSMDSVKFVNSGLQLNFDGGNNGQSFNINCFGARESGDGSAGEILDSLLIPMRGFLFNAMPDAQDICEGDTPEKLDATTPKGGNGNYSYIWQKTINLVSWSDVGNSEEDYQPGPLSDTTWFRRIVLSAEIKDTSDVTVVNVLPALQVNEISADTTICYNQDPLPINGDIVNGGNGSYTYRWEKSENLNTWNSVEEGSAAYNFDPPALTDTTWYRRIVNSHVCADTSNVLQITVLPSLENNLIIEDQVICMNDQPDKFDGSLPEGGNAPSFIYQWEEKSDNGSWSDARENNTSRHYQAPPLNDTTHYRRIVMSGPDNVCKDTTATLIVIVLQSISGNSIFQDQITCENDIPEQINGSLPAGGEPGSYAYRWEQSFDQSGWDSVGYFTGQTFYQPVSQTDTSWFRRIVLSGAGDACKDTSDQVKIMVQPAILNNIISGDTTICYGQTPDQLNGTTPLGGEGAGTYQYTWQSATNPVTWQAAPGVNNQPDFSPPLLTDTTHYRRRVESGVCNDWSDTLTIIVLPSISGNILPEDTTVCYNTSPGTLGSNSLTGGAGSYSYVWQSTTNDDWSSISGGNNRDYIPPGIPEPIKFRRIVRSGPDNCCIDTSAAIQVTLDPLPTALLASYTDTICENISAELNLTFTGQSPWQVTYSNGYEQSLGTLNTKDAAISVTPLTEGNSSRDYQYTLVEVRDGNLCYATEKSGEVNVVVYKNPDAKAGEDIEVCGPVVSLNANPSVGDGSWESDEEVIFEPNNTVSDPDVTVPGYGTYTFTWNEQNWECSSSDEMDVIFYEQPAEPDAGVSDTINFTSVYSLDGSQPTAGSGTWEIIDGSGFISNPNFPGAEISDLEFGTTT
ncbi:MAG: hypothetical protein ACLFUC_07325, partial [Bacteroidales bacterium]